MSESAITYVSAARDPAFAEDRQRQLVCVPYMRGHRVCVDMPLNPSACYWIGRMEPIEDEL